MPNKRKLAIWRILVLVLAGIGGGLVVVNFLAYFMLMRGTSAKPQTTQAVNMSAPETPQWITIGRQELLKQTVTFQNYFQFPPLEKWPAVDRSKFRFVMTGRFISTSADARLVFFDQENYQRWVKRYPPFPLAAFKPMEPVNLTFTEAPGFVVIDPPAQTPGLDLSSVSAALLSFVRMQAAKQQVSQATIDLSVMTEAYITPSEAAAMKAKMTHEH